jgi:hypothetical protein
VAQAFADGADAIVVGRPIRLAADPQAAAGPSSRKSRRRWLHAEIPLRRLQVRIPTRAGWRFASAGSGCAESPKNLP